MKRRRRNEPTVSESATNVKEAIRRQRREDKEKYDGDLNHMISTGSTLLDLAISGERIRGGGVPGGIFVEIFGPSGCGKTVLLCEMAGAVLRKGGQVKFRDPEARLNKRFASLFDFEVDDVEYDQPNTVTELFEPIRTWNPQPEGKLHGIFGDSLAALSTDLEMENEEGDKMGMRRAKEFSQELRKTARILTQKNFLMACSNQIRDNGNATGYGEKTLSPGGKAIAFYASLRLRGIDKEKVTKEVTVAGKKIKQVIGIKTTFEVYKSSVDSPYRTAPLYIMNNYGIDDIRANLHYLKTFTKSTSYCIGSDRLGSSMEDAIDAVEQGKLERILKEHTIELWMEINEKFKHARIPKRR